MGIKIIKIKGKSGFLDLTAEPLAWGIFAMIFFIILWFPIVNFGSDQALEKRAHSIEAGLMVEAMQGANGKVTYNYQSPFSISIENNLIAISSKNSSQKSTFKPIKDNSITFIDSQSKEGTIRFVRDGGEIFIDKGDQSIKTGLKLNCPALKNKESLNTLSILIDPAHGGIDESANKFTDSTGKIIDEGILTYKIASSLSAKKSSFAQIHMTRDSDNKFVEEKVRLENSQDPNISISIHIGDLTNKEKIILFVPDDLRKDVSQSVACSIANEFSADFELFYPRESSIRQREMLQKGNMASIYIEIGSIDQKINYNLAADAIFRGIKNAFE